MRTPAYSIMKYKKIEELREMWQTIYFGNPRLQPCQSYEFCAALVNDYRFSRQRLFLKPVFFVVFCGSEPRVILPLWRKSAGAYYLIPDFLITPYRDFISCAGCTAADFEQAYALVKRELGGSAMLHLRRINERSALFAWLAGRFSPANPKPCVRIAFLSGFDEWRRSLSKNARQNLRTAENRLLRDGRTARLSLDIGGGLSDAEWHEVIALHIKRTFLRDGVKTGPLTNWVRRNHDPIEKLLRSSKNSFLARLYIDGTLAAFFNGLLTSDGKTVCVFRLSIHDDFDFYSPGALLLSRSIEALAARSHITTLDLCYGSQPYKYRMGGTQSLDWDFVC